MARDARVFVFDHVSIGVADLARAGDFYDACLAPLGLVRLWSAPRAIGYGPEGYAAEAPFALVEGGAEARSPGRGAHFAFVAPSRGAVDRYDCSMHSVPLIVIARARWCERSETRFRYSRRS